MKNLRHLILSVALLALMAVPSLAQHNHGDDHKDVELHVNSRWKECSFQLDASLTQDAWREFAKEAALVAYFRPLTDAKPLGVKKFEIAIVQWQSKIDDTKEAWNDTFVHPDSAHWLIEGPRLPISGLTARMGVTEKLDVGIYVTKSPGANYGFYAVQAQYNLYQNTARKFNSAIRGSFVNMYGPKDMKFSIYSADLLASKDFVLHERWAVLSPYAGISTNVSSVREKSEVTEVRDENVLGVHGMIGLAAKVAKARLGVEYSLASVNTVSMKIGIGF